MESYVIFTESTGDLTPALIEQAQLRVLPMSFNLDGQEYRNWPDGREISSHDYYDKLRAGSACTTSQVTLADYEEAFTPVLEAGQDILYLAFSSGLSGTYQASCVAVGMLQEKFPSRRIACVDSKQASMGEGLFAYLVARKRLAGASFDEALAYAQELAPTVCAWFTVDDLMFLKRGGRLRRGGGGRHAAGHQAGAPRGRRRPPGGHGEGPRPPRQPGRFGQALPGHCPRPQGRHGVHQPRGLRGRLPVRGGQAPRPGRHRHPAGGHRPRHRGPQRSRHRRPVLGGRPPLKRFLTNCKIQKGAPKPLQQK